MKFISCNELRKDFCGFIASGETDKEVRDIILDHIEIEHFEKFISDREILKLNKKINRVLIYQ